MTILAKNEDFSNQIYHLCFLDLVVGFYFFQECSDLGNSPLCSFLKDLDMRFKQMISQHSCSPLVRQQATLVYLRFKKMTDSDSSTYFFNLMSLFSIKNHILQSNVWNRAVGEILGSFIFYEDDKFLSENLVKVWNELGCFLHNILNCEVTNPELLQAFVESGNFETIVSIFGMYESFINCNLKIAESYDFSTGNTKYNFFAYYTVKIIEKCIKGAIKISDAHVRDRVLGLMEQALSDQLFRIETLTRKLTPKNLKSPNSKNIRMNSILKFLGAVLFAKYFLVSRDGRLALRTDSTAHESDRIFANHFGDDCHSRKVFYAYILQNHFFFLGQIAGVHKESKIALDYYEWKYFQLLFSCLFHLDSHFRPVLLEQLRYTLDRFVSTEKTNRFSHFFELIMHFVYETTVNDNIFEEFFCTIGLDHHSDEMNRVSSENLESIQSQIPGIVQKLRTTITLMRPGVDKMYSTPNWPCSTQKTFRLTELLYDSNFRFDKRSHKFVSRQKFKKVGFHQNLFFSDKKLFAQLLIEITNQGLDLSRLSVFFWHHQRARNALDFLRASGLSEWLWTFYWRVRSEFAWSDDSGQLEQVADAVGAMALLHAQFVGDQRVMEEFCSKILDHSGSQLKRYISSLAADWKCGHLLGSSPQSNLTQSTVKRKSKSRVKSLLQKIKKKCKTSSKTKSTSEKSEDMAPSCCLICNEPFSESNSACFITKVHDYQPECLLDTVKRTTNRFHMFTTCAHKFHRACISQQSTLACLICNQSGSVLFSNQSDESESEKFVTALTSAIESTESEADGVFEFLLFPVLQSIRCLKLISEARLVQNILPVLRLGVDFLYFASDESDSLSLKAKSREHFELLLTELNPLTRESFDNFECVLEQICAEFLLGKLLIIDQIRFARECAQTVPNCKEKKSKINAFLAQNIQNHLWQYIMLKALQSGDHELNQINEDFILTSCFDLIRVAVFLEQILAISDTENLERDLQKTVLEDQVRSNDFIAFNKRLYFQIQRDSKCQK